MIPCANVSNRRGAPVSMRNDADALGQKVTA